MPRLRRIGAAAVLLLVLLGIVTGKSVQARRDEVCGPMSARLQCIEQTVPILKEADCSAWRCRDVPMDALPYNCCVSEVPPDSTAALLDGSAVAFLGTGSRYAAYQLISHVTGQSFDSFPLRESTSGAVTGDGGSFHVSSHEDQQIGELLAVLPREPGVYPDVFAQMKNASHRVFVMSYAAHDVRRSWRSIPEIELFMAKDLSKYVATVMAAVTRMKQSTLVRSGRDFIIYQESIPVGPGNRKPDYPAMTNGRRDPINDQLAAVGRAIKSQLKEDHPDVAYLDMQWTRARNGIGRHACAPYDVTGSRFTSAVTRAQANAQVLHAIKLLLC